MTVANVTALAVVGTVAAREVLGIQALVLKTNVVTAMFAMGMENALFVLKKLLDGHQFMLDMRKTIVSIVELVATVDSAWETGVEPVGRVEFARPAAVQETTSLYVR